MALTFTAIKNHKIYVKVSEMTLIIKRTVTRTGINFSN